MWSEAELPRARHPQFGRAAKHLRGSLLKSVEWGDISGDRVKALTAHARSLPLGTLAAGYARARGAP